MAVKIDWDKLYKERIEQIEIDEKKAIRDKKWTNLAKLKAEKAKLLAIIE